MNRNVKIAKELIKLAKSLVASERGICEMWDKSTGDFFEGGCILHFNANDDATANEEYVKKLAEKINRILTDANYYYEKSDNTYRIAYNFDEEDWHRFDEIKSILEQDGWEIHDEDPAWTNAWKKQNNAN